MRTIKVEAGQCLIDIAVQYLGDASRAGEIAALNGLSSITDDIEAGTSLIIPDIDKRKVKLAEGFKNINMVPASATIKNEVVNQNNQGIDYWVIGDDFVIQ